MRGQRIAGVEARGKNLLVRFEGESDGLSLVLLTHLGMNGAWRTHAPGDPPPHRTGAVVVWLEMEDGSLAICSRAPTVRILRARDLDRDPRLASLGPDLLSDFEPERALSRLRARDEVPLGEALLDQRAVSGIGNEWKSELCFEHGLDPFAPVGAFTDEELSAVLASAARGLRRSAAGRPRPKRVYRRAGEPCFRCGEPLVMRKQGRPARSTYFCLSCQPPRDDGQVSAPIRSVPSR